VRRPLNLSSERALPERSCEWLGCPLGAWPLLYRGDSPPRWRGNPAKPAAAAQSFTGMTLDTDARHVGGPCFTRCNFSTSPPRTTNGPLSPQRLVVAHRENGRWILEEITSVPYVYMGDIAFLGDTLLVVYGALPCCGAFDSSGAWPDAALMAASYTPST